MSMQLKEVMIPLNSVVLSEVVVVAVGFAHLGALGVAGVSTGVLHSSASLAVFATHSIFLIDTFQVP